MGGCGAGGTGPAMQVGKGGERQHPEQADLGGAFRTQGRNEPVVGSGTAVGRENQMCSLEPGGQQTLKVKQRG